MSLLIKPPGAARQPRWSAPEPVPPPSGRALRARWNRFSERLGVHPAGWLLLVVVLVCALAGWLLRWGELRMIALAGALLLIVALAFTIGRRSYQVALQLSARRVVVGQPAEGSVLIRNVGSRGSLPSRLEVPVGTQVAGVQVPHLAVGGQHEERFVIPTQRRGVVPIGPATSIQGDPFGLTGRLTRWSEVLEVFVHPRTVTLPGRQAGFVHDLEGHPSVQLSPSDMSFHALREYVPGDDRRHVHWKSTARTGQLMVRQYEETRQSRVAIGIDLAATSYLGEEDFEDAISVAASLAVQAIREANPLALLTNDDQLPAVSGPRALDEMARLETAPIGSVFDLVTNITMRAPSASVVFLVTGAGTSMADLRRAARSFGLDIRVIGINVDPAAALLVRSLANISLLHLSELSQLPRALRRAM